MRIVRVRPATAAAITNGEGQYPSSDPWCSDSVTMAKPWSSAQAHWSSAARYSASAGVPNDGARRS
jgi:hypothetical protein